MRSNWGHRHPQPPLLCPQREFQPFAILLLKNSHHYNAESALRAQNLFTEHLFVR